MSPQGAPGFPVEKQLHSMHHKHFFVSAKPATVGAAIEVVGPGDKKLAATVVQANPNGDLIVELADATRVWAHTVKKLPEPAEPAKATGSEPPAA